MSRRALLSLARLGPCLLTAALAAGCAGVHLDDVPSQTHVREQAAAYRHCVKTAAQPLLDNNDITPQGVAATAIKRCSPRWRAFIDVAEQDYLLQTHSPSNAHRLAMSDAFDLNMALQDDIEQRARAVRDKAADSG